MVLGNPERELAAFQVLEMFLSFIPQTHSISHVKVFPPPTQSLTCVDTVSQS